MSGRALALLGAPGPDGFGRHAIVVREDGSRRLAVYGAQPLPTAALASEDLEELIARGDAMSVDSLPAVPGPDWCAGFLGKDFEADAQRLGQTARPPGRWSQEAMGKLWVGRSEDVHRHLEDWLLNAAETIFEGNEADRRARRSLALLMLHVFPTRIETRAALWSTAPEDEKERTLAHFAHRASPRGVPPNVGAIRAEFESVICHFSSGLDEFPPPSAPPLFHEWSAQC